MNHEESSQAPMICPECGAQMNHHAIKVDYSVEDAIYDPAFGGVLEEVHTCPHCGRTELISGVRQSGA